MLNKFLKFKNINTVKRNRGIFPTRVKKLRLDANERISKFENNFINNIKKKISSFHFTAYPETEKIYDLLSKKYNLLRSNFLITSGSDIGIRHCFELFTQKNSSVITLNPTFGMVDVYCKIYETKQIKVGYDKNLILDYKRIYNSINKKVSMIMIANPNSPTGTVIESKKLLDIIKKANKNSCYVVIDEAYFGFYKISLLPLIKKFKNLIILRTFSKAFGLAGIRAGFIASNKSLIKKLYAFRPMYEISSITCLTIEEILKNQNIINRYVSDTLKGKKYLVKELEKLGFSYYETHSNFILVNFNSKSLVDKIYKELKRKGILARKAPNIEACKKHLRFTLGPTIYMKKLALNLGKITKK
jgi:histidinol-phosphate aminotransferase|tara:strand:+ start:626 stop:1702 length:1077 start_codon:yes stop_codon:yes gene_type:complete